MSKRNLYKYQLNKITFNNHQARVDDKKPIGERSYKTI